MYNGYKVWSAEGESVVGENASEAMSKNECSHFWCHGQGCTGCRKVSPPFPVLTFEGHPREQDISVTGSRPPSAAVAVLNTNIIVVVSERCSPSFIPPFLLSMSDLVLASPYLFPWPLFSFFDSLPYSIPHINALLCNTTSLKGFLFLGLFLFCKTAVSKAELAIRPCLTFYY